MAFFPGRQRAKTSPRTRSPRRSGGGRSRRTAPTPLKTGPGLSPEVNAQRMAMNRSRGAGDSAGRSRGDPNFGKPPTAPSSQFRTGAGAAFVKGKVKPAPGPTRAEFQRSLARRQQVSKSARKFISDIKEQQSISKKKRAKLIKKVIPKKEEKKSPKMFGGIDIQPAKKQKGLARVQQILSKQRGKALTEVQTSKSAIKRQFNGIVVLGGLGAARGALGVVETVRHPIKTIRNLVAAVRTPRQTIRVLGEQFIVDPVGVAAEFAVYSKTLNLLGKTVKKSPVGRFVQEEMFIRSQPKALQPSVRAILKASKIQEKLQPRSVRNIRRVNFLEVKSLKPVEAKAIAKTVRQTDSVIFGSVASRTIGGRRLPIPKDVDLATASVRAFNQKFLNNLPPSQRAAYIIKGQKIIRKSTNTPILDIKPLSRLIPQKGITGKGQIPAVGYVRKLKTTKKSLLPKIVKKPGVGKFTVPTQKIQKVKGIKLTGFGEQTTRKGLGTLQVLIEKNPRRAKDPQAFLVGLKVQKAALKKARPKTAIGRAANKVRIDRLTAAIRLLSSKKFAQLLERKVPGLTKEFPLLKRLSPTKIRKINPRKVAAAVSEAKLPKAVKRAPKRAPSKRKKKVFPKPVRKAAGKVLRAKRPKPLKRKKVVSSRVSRLPKRRSKIPKSRLSSKLKPSKIKPSKTPPSKPRPSKTPPSKPRPSKIVPSKPRPSKTPPSRISKLRASKITASMLRSAIRPSIIRSARAGLPVALLGLRLPQIPKLLRKKARTRKDEERIIRWVKKQKLKFRPSLVAILFNITGFRVPKKITGFEVRPIILRRRKVKKPAKRKKLKRKASSRRKKKK